MAKDKPKPAPQEEPHTATTVRIWTETLRMLRMAADHRDIPITELMHELARRELARLLPDIRVFLDEIEQGRRG